MTNRPAGGARSQKWERSDYDWYKEPREANLQLFDTLEQYAPMGEPGARDLIYDPCCGSGWILDEAKSRGYPTYGSDVVDRKARHKFSRGNILYLRGHPTPPSGRMLSVVCNPPYSYEDDIAEKIIRRVIEMPVRRAVFILPLAFLAGQGRWSFFMRDARPSHVLIYSERHTMPPGGMIETMDNAFKGGMQDYCVLVYTGPRHRWRTEIIWIKPDGIN